MALADVTSTTILSPAATAIDPALEPHALRTPAVETPGEVKVAVAVNAVAV